MAIQIKTLDQLKIMRQAGLLVGQTLELIRTSIKAGMTTDALDAIAAANIKRGGGISNFKGYHGFPATICVSVNEEIVHGIPGSRVINEGDIVSIDCGAIIDGWHGDAAISVGVGPMDPEDQKLMDVCEESMWRGIAAGKNGARLSDIGYAIAHVLNFGKAGNGPEIVPGLALAIEPMITRGSPKTKVLGDDWTVVSADKTRGAHFENSYAILPDGKPYVLTAIDGGRAELARLGIEISDLL